jgi:5,10-methylenetetrahydromethanopterin reductase
VKFGVGLISEKPVGTLSRNIKLADDLNFDNAWVSDQFNNRNVFVTLTYAATVTQRIKLGTGVVNPYFRHPSILASAAASLNEASKGRAVLGIGTGAVEGAESSPAYSKEDRFKRIGQPLRTTREAVEIIRKLLAGGNVTYDGEVFRTRQCKLNFPPMEIPIYLGARRKLMFRMAGELADGVITHGIDEGYIKYVIGEIKKGAEKSGRSLDSFDLAVWTYLSTSQSEHVKKTFRIFAGWLAESLPDEALPFMNLNEGTLEKIKKMRELIAVGRIEESAKYVDDKLSDTMHILGNKEKCIEAIEKAVHKGVTQIVIATLDEELKSTLEFVGKEIMPLFK